MKSWRERQTDRQTDRQNSELYYTRIKILNNCLFLQSVPKRVGGGGGQASRLVMKPDQVVVGERTCTLAKANKQGRQPR